MKRHPTVQMEYRGEPVDIDAGIAALVAEVWRLGLDTVTCCERGDDGRAWIEFADPGAAALFLAEVASVFDTDLESLWNRATRQAEPDDDWRRFRRERLWTYGAKPIDYSVALVNGTLQRHGEAAFDFTIFVRFPPSDIGPLTELLRGIAT